MQKIIEAQGIIFIRITNEEIDSNIKILKCKIKYIIENPSPFQISGRGAVDVYISWGEGKQ